MNLDVLTWSVSLAIVAAIVLPYVLAFRRRRHADRARKAEAVQLGFDRPTAQYPFVDPMACIGCGSCVAACPEGDVLGVVGGVATVVNGLRCVGHARCEIACPVGAIKVGLGDVRSRADVPLMDEWHETSVPGMFVAGELSGMALVKNAVSQGRKVVDRIAQRASPGRARGTGDVYDVAVVGAGPAGLTAAALAREQGLSSVLLEQEPDLGGTILHYPRRKLVLVQALEIPFLGALREGEYEKEDLLETFQDLTRRARLNVRFGAKVTGVSRPNGHFAVRTAEAEFPARFVILALGRRGTPRRLGVPGEELPKVTYQLVDAASYEGKRVLVVGGGDSAVEAAIGLARQRGNRVTLSYRREKLVRIKKKNEDRIAGLLASRRVEAEFGTEVEEIGPASVRLKTPVGPRELPNDYVFVFAGGEPPFGLLRQMGVRFGGEAGPPPRRS
ncbi:MAG TPA: NAD(P)-binding domain-containing protein [Vicinamibacteria bacterium]|nr:NAD(P)-binding domain-containing protein [Vicinamibacteria bacterium]